MADDSIRYGLDDDDNMTGLQAGDTGYKGGATPDPDADLESGDDWTDVMGAPFPEIPGEDEDDDSLSYTSGSKGGATGNWQDENPKDTGLGLDEDDVNAIRSRVPPSTEPGFPLM
ncbi:MAG TPA: hypothetical protein VGM37_16110 [Armatimonadota bacterium]|jgi:hypothetical protein